MSQTRFEAHSPSSRSPGTASLPQFSKEERDLEEEEEEESPSLHSSWAVAGTWRSGAGGHSERLF